MSMMRNTWAKSSHSSANGNCLEARWAGSSHSESGNCLEARQDSTVQVRDSKLGGASAVLSFSPGAWAAFLAGLKAR